MLKFTVKILLVLFVFVKCVTAQVGVPPGQETEEVRKKREEYQKKVAEIQEKNRKIIETNERIAVALKEGLAAYSAKNYELAIEKFDLCYRLDPEFAGTATVALVNKAMSLRALGMLKYNAAVIAKKDPVKAGLHFFSQAVTALESSKALLETEVRPTRNRSEYSPRRC